MRGKTRFQKPRLIIGPEKTTRKRRSSRISDRLEQDDVKIKSCLNVEPRTRSFLDTLELGAQLEEEIIPSKLSGETSSVWLVVTTLTSSP